MSFKEILIGLRHELTARDDWERVPQPRSKTDQKNG